MAADIADIEKHMDIDIDIVPVAEQDTVVVLPQYGSESGPPVPPLATGA
jgi:hypothetical protein